MFQLFPDKFPWSPFENIMPNNIMQRFSIFLFRQWSYFMHVVGRNISGDTCSALINTHTQKQTSYATAFSTSAALSWVFIITWGPLIILQTHTHTHRYTHTHTHTHTHLTCSLSCRLASLDVHTWRRAPSSSSTSTQRPLLKLMEWKSHANVWPLNTFLHFVLQLWQCACLWVVYCARSN